VLAVSALTGSGIAAVRELIEHRAGALRASGALERRRTQQAQAALWREIGEGLIEALKADAALARRLGELEADVAARTRTPTAAARAALDEFLHTRQNYGDTIHNS
jgi:LAO/AO transport system kinase